MARTFHVESLGCAKNQVDAELMIAALEGRGWRLAPEPDGAEVLIVNTCGFIETAKRESIETGLGLRARFPHARIILVGCLTERYPGELARELPEIDGFLGNRDPARIVAMVEAGSARVPSQPEGPAQTAPVRRRTHLLSLPGSAYLKVAEGCDNRCTYCAIPLIRGALASRAPGEIVAEARDLLARGIRELVLIAQDLGSYGADRRAAGLPDLLRSLSGLTGDFWVRMLYLHPDHFPDNLLAVMRDDRRILPYLDVPFQHASPRILAAMGRRPDPERNLRLVRRIRETLPDAVVRSTLLVGFPGETEEDVEQLLAFQQEAAFDWLGTFSYSREEGTPAWGLPGRVPARRAAQRKALVEERQVPITVRRLDRVVGRTLDVLVEERVQGEELSLGRAYLQAPEVDGAVVVRADLEPGSFVRVTVDRRNGFDLEASPVAAGSSDG